MNHELTLFKTLCCTSLILSNVACTSTHHAAIQDVTEPAKQQYTVQKRVYISQLNAYSKMHDKQNAHTKYILQMASFSGKTYADQYKKYLQHLTTEPVTVEPSKDMKRYNVYVGPFYDIHTMVEVGQQLKKKPGKVVRTHVATPIRTTTAVVHTTVTPVKTAFIKPVASQPVVKKTIVTTPVIQHRTPVHAVTKPVVSSHPASHSVYVQKTTTHAKHVVKTPVVQKTEVAPQPIVVKQTVVAQKTVSPVKHVIVMPATKTTANPHKGTAWKDMTVDTTPLFVAGPYVGGTIGGLSAFSSEPMTWYRGFQGIVSAGWGTMVTRRFYLAGEAFFNDSFELKNRSIWYNGQVSSSGVLTGPNARPVGVQTSWSFGGDIIPGFMVTDHVLGYLRGGVVRTEFQNVARQDTAWQVGIGAQTSLIDHLDLRAEYVYSLYSRIADLGRPQTDQYNIGVVYKFAQK